MRTTALFAFITVLDTPTRPTDMYNATVLSLFQSPSHMGELPDADAIGQAGRPGEGPFMTMYLKMEGERIGEARFATYGCPAAVACGSFVTQWVRGKTAQEASVLTAEDLQRVMGGLPLGKEHCAGLAIDSLRQALIQRMQHD